MARITGKFTVKIKTNLRWWFKLLPIWVLERILKVEFKVIPQQSEERRNNQK